MLPILPLAGQDSIAVAVLTIGGGRCSWRASPNSINTMEKGLS